MFLGIKRHEEEVAQNKQRTLFYFLEFRLNYPLGFCHLQCFQKLRGVCIESVNAGLACLIPQCGAQETLPSTGRPGDEEVLRLSDELQRGQPFHLVSVKPTAMQWSFMRFVSSRDTALRSFSARTGAVFSFVFIFKLLDMFVFEKYSCPRIFLWHGSFGSPVSVPQSSADGRNPASSPFSGKPSTSWYL